MQIGRPVIAGPEAIYLVDYEGNDVTVSLNGDPTKTGAFLEVGDAHGGPSATVHLTPETMLTLGAWLINAVRPR